MTNTTASTGGSTSLTKAAVIESLGRIVDPCSAASASPMSIVEMGLVKEVRISDDGDVAVELRLSAPACYMVSYMASHARAYISEIPGVRAVEVTADAGLDWDPAMIEPAAAERRNRALAMYAVRATGGNDKHGPKSLEIGR